MEDLNCIRWRFAKKHHAQFGRALYISGSVPSMGSWNINSAMQLSFFECDNWAADIAIPKHTTIEYKYFEADFQHPGSNPIWQEGPNRVLNSSSEVRQSLTIMTFNIRYDNPDDGSNRWDNRKDNICAFLEKQMPCVLGLQEAKPHQRRYIEQRLRGLYQYVGVPRDLWQDEQVGVFFLSNRFFLLDSGFVWLNEDGSRGKPGFGCVLPRNLTYVVLRDCILKEKILCVNTHLDLSAYARQRSIPILLKTIRQLVEGCSESDPIRRVYLFGDFNCSDNNPIFEQLYSSMLGFKSARSLGEWDDKTTNTFNGFQNYYVGKVLGFFAKALDMSAVIDHIFVATHRTIKGFRVIRGHSPLLSDHYPVEAEFL